MQFREAAAAGPGLLSRRDHVDGDQLELPCIKSWLTVLASLYWQPLPRLPCLAQLHISATCSVDRASKIVTEAVRTLHTRAMHTRMLQLCRSQHGNLKANNPRSLSRSSTLSCSFVHCIVPSACSKAPEQDGLACRPAERLLGPCRRITML